MCSINYDKQLGYMYVELVLSLLLTGILALMVIHAITIGLYYRNYQLAMVDIQQQGLLATALLRHDIHRTTTHSILGLSRDYPLHFSHQPLSDLLAIAMSDINHKHYHNYNYNYNYKYYFIAKRKPISTKARDHTIALYSYDELDGLREVIVGIKKMSFYYSGCHAGKYFNQLKASEVQHWQSVRLLTVRFLLSSCKVYLPNVQYYYWQGQRQVSDHCLYKVWSSDIALS